VSNLGEDHWFVIIASLNPKQSIMWMIPVKLEGLVLESKTDYIGLNGSVTYSCNFRNVFIPDKWILTEDADQYIQQVRPILALYQIPLGLGISQAAIESIVKTYSKNIEVNKHVKPQPKELIDEIQCIRKNTYTHAKTSNPTIYLEGNIANKIGNCQDNPESSPSRHGLFLRTSIYTGE
jgi:hypothetical protein